MANAPTVLVLLSGGLDSATNLALASVNGHQGAALTVSYGQRAAAAERKAASSLAAHYGFQWLHLEAPWVAKFSQNALTNVESALPDLAPSALDNLESARDTARAVWVANRNGLLINMAAVIAEAQGFRKIFVGFNREEATTFPDNSSAFLTATNQALAFSTQGKVRVDSFTIEWDKTQIMREAKKLALPMELVWSCYTAGPRACGVCESCRRFQRAQEQSE